MRKDTEDDSKDQEDEKKNPITIWSSNPTFYLTIESSVHLLFRQTGPALNKFSQIFYFHRKMLQFELHPKYLKNSFSRYN